MTPVRARCGASVAALFALVAACAASGAAPARAADVRAGVAGASAFPAISFRAFPGVSSSTGADSTVSRKVTIRWERDRTAEARSDFGGYRIYRQTTVRDTTNMELLRRFAVFGRSPGDTLADGSPSTYAQRDTLLWYFPDDQDMLQFVDPDSAGSLVKVCREYDELNRCASPGDSVLTLLPPGQPPGRPDISPIGPHDGYPVYYTIVYGALDQTLREVTEMFVPDTLGAVPYERCNVPGDPTSCPNLNNKALNLMARPVYVTGPARSNVETVIVVPNPYRGSERWDEAGVGRIQFQNLPVVATVRIYTVAGDLVRELSKSDPLTGSLDWNLQNADGREVSSGIYVYHVESGEGFEARGNFVVIR